MTIIKGFYSQDNNFTTVFSNNTVYTIARNTGDWGCRKVGEWLACGDKLTQATYDRWLSECSEVGTFELV